MPLYTFHPLWRLILWASYAAWCLFEIWVFSRDRRARQGQTRDGGSLPVLVVLIVLGIFVAFSAPYMLRLARMHGTAGAVFCAAIILMWSGMMLRLWAILTLGRFFRTTVFLQDAHRLVTAGPYRLLRHPAYTGGIMTLAGIGLAMGNWVSLTVATLCGLAGYAWRIRVEERALQARFGDAFEQNRDHTWAVIPFVW